jgi:hypothetical protein
LNMGPDQKLGLFYAKRLMMHLYEFKIKNSKKMNLKGIHSPFLCFSHAQQDSKRSSNVWGEVYSNRKRVADDT